MVSEEELRNAMGRFATGVALITTLEEDGGVHAMTANSLTSISLAPALVLVSVAHHRNTYRYIRLRGCFAINVLRQDQADLAWYFAKDDHQPEEQVSVEYRFTQRGTPGVHGCICFLDCEVVASHDHGDHAIFIGEVKETYSTDGDPLVFYQGRLLGLDQGAEPK